MLHIKSVSLRSFCVGLRWARRKGFPEIIEDWSQEQAQQLQDVCRELDKRRDRKRLKVYSFERVENV
jgi:hypothetical protein